eukprot:m.895802 g.895802  ORF g.895802 m.895802 type:complete len:453 (+) comp23664_c1_seq93:1753-3111(+)
MGMHAQQGKHNHHEADGVTNLYYPPTQLTGTFAAGGPKTLYEDIFPVIDAREFPGIVAEVDIPIMPCDDSSYNTWPASMNYTTFVGGVSDGAAGAAAMQLSSRTLTSNIGWFFFDDAFVHINSQLACTSTSRVVSTVANHRWLGGAVSVVMSDGTASASSDVRVLPRGTHNFSLPDVSFVHVGFHAPGASKNTTDTTDGTGTGYVFLHVQPEHSDATASRGLQIVNDVRSGNWSALGTSTGTASVDMLQLFVQHGRCADLAADQTLGYVVVPNTTVVELQALVNSHAYGDLNLSADGTAMTAGIPEDATPSSRPAARRVRREAIFFKPGEIALTVAAAAPWPCGNAWTLSSSVPALAMLVIEGPTDGTCNVAVSVSTPDLSNASVELLLGSTDVTGTLHCNASTPFGVGGGVVNEKRVMHGDAAATKLTVTTPGGDYMGATVDVQCEYTPKA